MSPKSQLHMIGRRCWVFTSHCNQDNSKSRASLAISDNRGLAVVIPKPHRAAVAPFTLEEIVPGRIAVLRLRTCGVLWAVYSVHNYGLSRSALDKFKRIAVADKALATKSPTKNFVLMAGDFNFLDHGDTPLALRRPEPRPLRGLPAPGAGRARSAWMEILASLTEVAQPIPTHSAKPPAMPAGSIDSTASSSPGCSSSTWSWPRSLRTP